MERNKSIRLLLITGLLLAGLTLGALLTLPTAARQWWGAARARPETPAASQGEAYSYVGVVDLEQVLPGELDGQLNPAAAAPENGQLPELGQIDLGLRLIESGQVISGHVDLEYTLVFSGEHQVDERWFGPAVQGSFDGNSLALTSERLSFSSAGRQLMRQFSLNGQLVAGQEDVFSGEYRETLWGYGPQPFTVLGTFRLRRALYVEPQPLPFYTELYLPVIVKN